jgi:hypothetical protein
MTAVFLGLRNPIPFEGGTYNSPKYNHFLAGSGLWMGGRFTIDGTIVVTNVLL